MPDAPPERRLPAPSPRRSLSVIAPAHNEEACLDAFLATVAPVLDSTGLAWEIVLVDDGSTDRTAELARAAAARESRIKLVRLARNFGKEAALTCGLDFATGDAVVPMDVDLQDPPEVLPLLVERWQAGAEVVDAVRSQRRGDSLMKRLTAGAFYRVMAALRVRLPRNVGDFRLLDRRVVTVLTQLRERNRFMKGLFAWPGFRTEQVAYERPERAAGHSAWGWWRLWNFALDGITGFTAAPLKIWFYFGFLVSLAAFAFAVVVALKKLLWGDPVAGYPSLMVAVLFLGGIQLMSLGVIGEYLARVFIEVKGRPLYVVGEAVGFDPPEV